MGDAEPPRPRPAALDLSQAHRGGLCAPHVRRVDIERFPISTSIIRDHEAGDAGPGITRAQYVDRYLAEHGLPAAYWKASRNERSAILDQAVDAFGYHRKSVIRLFEHLRRRAGGAAPRAGRPPQYSTAAKTVLAELWDLMDRPSERKLKGSLPEWLDALERAGELDLPGSVTTELDRMSASTMGRIVRAMRPRRLRSPLPARPHNAVQAAVPLRTWSDWQSARPGEVQLDTVFHSGGRGEEGFLYSLVAIDPYSGWTDARVADSLARRHIMPALDTLWRRSPFPWVAIHTDNGSEFINRAAVNWSKAHGIRRTRGRPAKSGDQAVVENANRRFVRTLVGDVRYQGAEAHDAMNELYDVSHDIANYFMARTRLVGKVRRGRRLTRRYDQPRTPYRRLLEAGSLDAEVEHTLERRFLAMNPAALTRERERLRDRVWALKQV